MYARAFDGKSYRFGVVGVEKGTLILYDAQTRSRWSQLFGKAISGQMAGTALEKVPSTMTTWKQWRTLHPETTVYVKRSTPYRPRFTKETFRRLATEPEGPIKPEDLIVGLEGHVDARAYPVRRLAKTRLLEDQFEGAPILVYLSDDFSTARVYSRHLDDRELRFRLEEGEILADTETGSRWNPVTGECTAGVLQGKQLQPLIATYSLWFAWKKYRPDTAVYGEKEEMTGK